MRLLLCLAALAFVLTVHAQERTVIEWTFDEDVDGWGGANHIADLAAADGELQGLILDWDPFVRSPEFEIEAKPWQTVRVRLKTDCDGGGQLYWTGTTESAYGGFSPDKVTGLQITGDGEWHEYDIQPYWHKEGKIILIRLDLPGPEEEAKGKATFALDWVRIVEPEGAGNPRTDGSWDFAEDEPWTSDGDPTVRKVGDAFEVTMGKATDGRVFSEPLNLEIGDRFWVAVEMAVEQGTSASLSWVSSDFSGTHGSAFRVIPDGKLRHYNIDLASHGMWRETILQLGLTPTQEQGGKATIRRVTVSDTPLGPADVAVTYAGLANAVNRAGWELPFIISLENVGGTDAADLRIASVDLPDGVSLVEQEGWRDVEPLAPFDPQSHGFMLKAEKPLEGDVEVTLTGTGAPAEPVTGSIRVEERLDMPKADYVPEPEPVESDYEIGALYFPGWASMDRWDPIRRVAPERKPVLGWYDESNPECADWQIKWAVEHGIGFFMVDWYWSAGGRHLEHWVHDAYMKSRYRKYLKWCMMWANHNAPNTHSEEDQRAVTQYWLDNYFGMEEYYRIDDMPVVMMWSVANMDRDMAGKGGAKRLLDISQEMAREAGYKGIYFVAMKWSEASTELATIEKLRDTGFSMTSIYHYMDHGGKATNPRRYPFDMVAEASLPFIEAWHESSQEAGIPFLPNLSTGWASQPWHGEKGIIIRDRTVPLFQKICEDAKGFADRTGVKRMVLAPLNEWGEGSYAEPCKEFGFGMYDAVRDVFCKEPAGGWPPNIAPQDVGLGPYDFDEPAQRTVWDFADGKAQGWGVSMGIGDFEVVDETLTFTTGSRDPALGVGLYRVTAQDFKALVIRMKIDALEDEGEQMQLFWTTASMSTNEPASVKVELIGDGEFHDYVLPVGDNPRWAGRIKSFRLDPCSHAGAKMAIEEVRLVAE